MLDMFGLWEHSREGCTGGEVARSAASTWATSKSATRLRLDDVGDDHRILGSRSFSVMY